MEGKDTGKGGFNFVKALKIIGGLLVAYTVIGFLILPPLAKSILSGKLSEALHRQVTIEKIKFNPYVLSATLEGLQVEDKDRSGVFASFERLFVNLQTSSLFKLGLVVREFELVSPYCRIVLLADGTMNFADLLSGPGQGQDNGGQGFGFYIANIQVSGGSIDLVDEKVGKEHRVQHVEVALPFVANMKQYIDIFVEPHCSAEINGAPLVVKGQSKPFAESLDTEFTLDFNHVDLPYYLAYLPIKRNFEVTTGQGDLQITVTFSQTEGKPSTIMMGGHAYVSDLVMDDPAGKPIVRLARGSLVVSPSELLDGRIVLSELALEGPDLYIQPSPGGGVNLQHLVDSVDKEAPAEQGGEGPQIVLSLGSLTVVNAGAFFAYPGEQDGDFEQIMMLPSLVVTDTEIDIAQQQVSIGKVTTEQGVLSGKRLRNGDTLISYLAAEADSAGPKEPAVKPWQITLASLGLADYTVNVVDLAVSDPVEIKIAPLNLTVEEFSTAEKTRSKVQGDLRIDEQGSLVFSGDFGLTPLGFDLQVALNKISVKKAQSYLAGVVAINIADGEISGNGMLAGTSDEKGKLGLVFNGEAAVHDLAIKDLQFDDLLHWKLLSLKGIHAATQPLSVALETVSLDDFFANVIKQKNGAFNFTELLIAQEKSFETTADDSVPKDIWVEEVKVQGGRVDFVDRNIKPSYSATLREITGGIRGLTSKAGEMADVKLQGVLNRQGSLLVNGRVNPLAKDLAVDVLTSLKNIELSEIAPYSGKYIGYAVQKGKFFYDAHYKVNGTSIEMQNTVFVDQFTLGDQVDSPDAVKLPLKLGLALLKDGKGEIHLDLPVSGNLDDPEFSVGTIVFKMIANLIVKAVTSPFALLGAVFGGGDDLQFVDFESGRDQLDPAASTKLDILAAALNDRPALKLEIQGSADVVKDSEVLAREGLERLLKVEKMRLLPKKESARQSIDTVSIDPAEREKLLALAYKSAGITVHDAKNKKVMTPEELEKELLTTVEVSADDLRNLAGQRATTVRDYLVGEKQVAAERLFMLDPVAEKMEEQDTGTSRVSFTVK